MSATTEAPPRAPQPAPAGPPPASAPWGRGAAVLAGAVLVAGAVLRFFTRSDLWLDEVLTVNIAQLPLGDLGDALRHDGAPPLYYVLLHGWIDILGDGDLAVRSLSGILGLASLVPAWFVGRRLGGRFVAWAAVLVFASSPFAVRYATENRMYALQILLVLCGYLAVARALERASLGRFALVAIVTGLLMYTQYWSMYLIAIVGAGLVWWAFRAPQLADRQAARSVVVALAAGGITFIPWVPTFLYQAEHTGTPWGEAVFPATGIGTAVLEFAGGQHSEAFVLLVVLLLLVLLAVFGRGLDTRRVELDIRGRPGVRAEATAMTAALVLGLTAAFVAGTAFQGRYAAVVFPLFAVVVAYGITVFVDMRVRAAVLAAVVGLGLVGGVRNVVENRTQAHEAAEVIRAEARSGDVVAYCPDQVGLGVSRLLEGEDDLLEITFPDAGDPELIDWVDYQERVDRADPGRFAEYVVAQAGPRRDVWFVIAPGYRNFEGECEAIASAFSSHRPNAQTRVEPNDDFFEFQGLIQYPAQ